MSHAASATSVSVGTQSAFHNRWLFNKGGVRRRVPTAHDAVPDVLHLLGRLGHCQLEHHLGRKRLGLRRRRVWGDEAGGRLGSGLVNASALAAPEFSVLWLCKRCTKASWLAVPVLDVNFLRSHCRIGVATGSIQEPSAPVWKRSLWAIDAI